MNGAESLVRTLVASAASTPVSPIRAPARCTLSRRWTACRGCAGCSACRGRRDRRGRRLRPGAEEAGRDPAACGPGLANGVAICTTRGARGGHRQHGRRPGDLSPPARPAADLRPEGFARPVSLWFAGLTRLRDGSGRDAAAAVQAAPPPRADRDADPAKRAAWDEGGIANPLPVSRPANAPSGTSATWPACSP